MKTKQQKEKTTQVVLSNMPVWVVDWLDDRAGRFLRSRSAQAAFELGKLATEEKEKGGGGNRTRSHSNLQLAAA